MKEAFSKLPAWAIGVIAILAVVFVGWLVMAVLGILFGLFFKILILAVVVGAAYLFFKFFTTRH
ncbi:hypothetical protein BIV57_05645 [Mangrovactinospora gilvigrisea]|uniref:Uncharacterized protein n=2 Tax=Mangrovactinospora gilvigrisea TaxID=1428644 RepID=A0A1J7BIS6_9ACTN|nr:DUF5326 family protein [Mangrovactinospora gilvigrisea]OIV38485.1 hypothetical protein BIV57_05645 [Mangrovactinospora gilvigrisea]